MFKEIFYLILDTAAGLLGGALLLRAYFQRIRVDPYHPLVKLTLQITNFIVLPLRRIIPSWRRIDWSSLLAAWLVALVMWLLLFLIDSLFIPTFLISILWHALFTVLEWVLYLIIFITIVYVIVGWVNPHSPHAAILGDMARPLLMPLRKIIPTMGGFDWSPLVLLLLVKIGFIILQSLQRAII